MNRYNRLGFYAFILLASYSVFRLIMLQNAPLIKNNPLQKIPRRKMYNSSISKAAGASGTNCFENSVLEQSISRLVPELTCSKLLFGAEGSSAFPAAKNFMTENPPSIIPDSKFVQLAQDCDDFRNTRGYHLKALSAEAESYPIAYNIIMHRDVHQVERLLQTIYMPQNVYCIHVDARSNSLIIDAMRAIANCFSNVIIASKLEKIVYAGFSRLQADINCMSDLLRHRVKWKYLLNIAGQEFPLRTNEEIVNILKIYNGANDIEGLYYRKKAMLFRHRQEWIEVGVDSDHPTLKKTGKANPAPPHNLDIIKGSSYGVFSRAFVDYVINDPVATDFLNWCKTTYSPDEHFWATLHHTYSNPHLNPPGSYSNIPHEKPWMALYASWEGADKCSGRWQRGCCVFGIEDLPRITVRKEFFLNKVEASFQPLTFDCLQAWIRFKEECPPPLDYSYYKNFPFINRTL